MSQAIPSLLLSFPDINASRVEIDPLLGLWVTLPRILAPSHHGTLSCRVVWPSIDGIAYMVGILTRHAGFPSDVPGLYRTLFRPPERDRSMFTTSLDMGSKVLAGF